MRASTRLRAVLESDPLIRVRDHGDLADAVQRAHAQGVLVRLAPGVYALEEASHDWLMRCRALQRWQPDAVLCGATARDLLLERPGDPHVVCCAAPRIWQAPSFVRAEQRALDHGQVVERPGGLTMTSPALTALDLAASDNGATIDAMLHRGLTSLRQIEFALEQTPNRRGNAIRRRVVGASRAEPWSQAERALHSLLWRAGVTGWWSNLAIDVSGRRVLGDVAFPALKLVIEVDGFEFHSSRSAFEHDRERHNILTAAGWTVLHVTWLMLTEHADDVIRQIKQTLATLARNVA